MPPLVGRSSRLARDGTAVRTRVVGDVHAGEGGCWVVADSPVWWRRALQGGFKRVTAACARASDSVVPGQVRLRSRSRNGRSTTCAGTRPRRPSTVHSTSRRVPTGSYRGGTDASAMACLNIGLQPTLVALPHLAAAAEDRHRRAIDGRRDRRRQTLRLVQPLDPAHSSSSPTSRRGPARALLALQREPADEVALVQVDEPAEPDLERRIVLVGVDRVARRRVVDLDQDEAGLEPDHVERDASRPVGARTPCRPAMSASQTASARSRGTHSS